MKEQVFQRNPLGTEKIGRLLAKFAIPGIISMIVNSLYNIVDQIFIGQGVGYLGNGATNVIYPLTVFVMAFAMLLGDGAASYQSLMLGKRKEKDAAEGVAAGIVGIVSIGILMMVLYEIFLPGLCRMFGATDAILPYAVDYGRIIILGFPFCAVCVGVSSIIRADGDPRFNMIGLLVGCALNVIFDPLFIFVFHWGVKGAAFATIIGQIANGLLNVYYVKRKMKTVELNAQVYKGCLKKLPQISKLGVSSFISQITIVVVMAVQNNLLVTYGAASKYGAEIPMTALGVTMKIFNILLAVIIGLCSGSQPILGYNYGSRQYDRVKKTYKYILVCSTIGLTVAFVLFQTIPMTFIRIFGTSDPLYNEFSVKCLRIYLLMMPVAGLYMTGGVLFQSLGYPLQASILSLSKQILIQVPAMLILCRIMGVEGALWSGPVSDTLTFLLVLFLILKYWNKMFEEKPTVHELKAKDAEIQIHPKVHDHAGKPLIITISRTYGAAGRAVGKALADRLGIPYYDTEILMEISKKVGLDKEYLEFSNEKAAGDLMMYSGMVTSRGIAMRELEVLRQVAEKAQYEVIHHLAQEGSCVIVGRRADQILKNDFNVMRVFITMPMEDRIRFVAQRDGLSEKEAIRKIQRIDKERADYYNAVSDTRWGTPENYDICLDLGNLGTENAVQILMQMVSMR